MRNVLLSQIETIIRNHRVNLKFTQSPTLDEIRNAVKWVMRDNPDIFWFAHQYHYDESSSTIYFQYTFSTERIKNIQQSITDVVENDFCLEYVKTLPCQEQIAYVYKWLVTYCNYNTNSAYNQSIYSVFVRRNSVCTGYAKAAQYLFNLLGIESRLVFGRLHNDKEEGRHCWNIVKVDNQYYHFDACFGDSILDGVAFKSGIRELFSIDGINYNFLCVSTHDISGTRSIEDMATLPACPVSWSRQQVKSWTKTEIKQRDGVKGCLLSYIGCSADIYLCSKDKNTVLKVFRPDSKTTCEEEYRYMMQTRDCRHMLQCNERYTDISRNVIAIEQSTPIIDLLCSHYYELSWKGLIKMATDIAEAWRECKEQGVLYRDIHVCNIYRSNDGTFKLGDFGSCTTEFDKNEVVGNQWFMAPETYVMGEFDERSAIYAISMVIYFILNNLRPAFWQYGLDDSALRRRWDGERLPLPASCKNLVSDMEDKITDFFRKNASVYPYERSSDMDDFIADIQSLSVLLGGPNVIIFRNGAEPEFDVDNNVVQTESCQVYDAACDFDAEECHCEIIMSDIDLDGCISDVGSEVYISDDDLFVDEVENFARTMGIFQPAQPMETAVKEYNTYVPCCHSNGRGQWEQINHSIIELRNRISEETRLVEEQMNDIRENIGKETAIIESLQKSSSAWGAAIGGAISTTLIGTLIGGAIGALFKDGHKKRDCSAVNEEILEHQGRINELKEELTRLQNQHDKEKSMLQHQLDEHLALKEYMMNASDVYSSVFAPAEIKRKSHLQVQVYLHLYEETERVKSLAKESDKNAERRDYLPLSLKLRRGDKVDVDFNVYGESRLVSERKSVIWQGSFTKCSFDYFVSGNIDVDELSCEVNLFVNGAMIGEMRFLTQIVETPPKNLSPEVQSHRFDRIFISYAHQDARQIKLLALAYKAQGVDYFYDRDSLAPGDVYAEKIFDYIDRSDLFVLCWSENAAVSDYVAKEKGYALLRAYPQISIKDATLKICPISIEPRADLPSDMKEIYNFEVI